MAAETTVVKGINVKQLEAFNKQYAASPEKFTLGIQAKTTWEGQGLGNSARWASGPSEGSQSRSRRETFRFSLAHGKR